jgi:flagellum-specific ATP synthase
LKESINTTSLCYPQRSAVISEVGDLSLKAKGIKAKTGELWCLSENPESFGEVTATGENGFNLALYSRTSRIAPGDRIKFLSPYPQQPVGESLLGRILDGKGAPYDGMPEIKEKEKLYLIPDYINPLEREIIKEPLPTGVRSIDGLLTIGKGQKIGLFAGSGVGKSVLMGMISRGTSAQIRIVAMIGERGREVGEFIENVLGETLSSSIVFVSTSDSPPLMKLSGLLRAFAVGRWFASKGYDVLLLVDSLTRVATALRDLGLANGEPPVARGFTPSMYNYIPRILEQAGKFKTGSLTAISTVLVEESEDDNPVALTARSILDGHIVLSSALAQKAHFPAIDVLKSKSRVMNQVISASHKAQAAKIIETLSLFHDL